MNLVTARAYKRWRRLADRGYGERCNTPDAMKRTDDRIKQAKERYERLLEAERASVIKTTTCEVSSK
jgi:hypothetical protein